MAGFLARSERFDVVGSTNDVVRTWLDDGVPEVALAIADEQTAGRGREQRTWEAPRGAGLLLSLGFRPTWLGLEHAWRLAAVTSLAMADAAEATAGLEPGTIRLKWPNDLVVVDASSRVRKLAGVLGETTGLGTRDPRVIVGLGINVDWRVADFPSAIAASMTSLRTIAGDRVVDRQALTDGFVARVGPAVEALRAGRFDAAAWQARQVTTGRDVRLERPDGTDASVHAIDVDPESGALVVADDGVPSGRRSVVVGDITHVRFVDAVAAGV